jgi:hypothetical protein
MMKRMKTMRVSKQVVNKIDWEILMIALSHVTSSSCAISAIMVQYNSTW